MPADATSHPPARAEEPHDAQRIALPAGRSAIPEAPVVARQLTDPGAVVLAATVSLGAWWHHPIPLVVLAAAMIAAAVARHPWALVVVGFLAAGTLGARSFAGLHPIEAGPYRGRATLVADPETTPFGAKVDVRVGHRRVELWASGAAAGAVEQSLAGEALEVDGRLAPPRPGSPWLIPRHVVGKLLVDHAERASSGSGPWRAANRFRRLLQRGTEPMPEPARSLYAGFVLGDDRDQPPEIVDDFRGSGLSHLLVVSGQNVAFMLVLLAPVVARLGWRGRWVVTISVIVAFGVVTRFEPSVLRASAMAALAVTAGALGRPAGAVRNLALAVAGLVLIDPLLVRSVGFQLSVGASLAIGVLAEPIARRLPGPRVIAESVGVTVAAQVGVAPVLIPRFGGLPVVSLVANPLAVPVAGLVTTWGLPAGVVAGLCGGVVARVVQLPTVVMISWVAGVARVGASVPLGEVGAIHALALGALGLAVAVVGHPPMRRAALLAMAVVCLLPAVALRSPPVESRLSGGGSVYRAGGATVVVVPAASPIEHLLEDLRRAGVRRIDVAVVDARQPEAIARPLRHRWPIGRIVDARSGPAIRLRVGALVVTVDPPVPTMVEPAGRPP